MLSQSATVVIPLNLHKISVKHRVLEFISSVCVYFKSLASLTAAERSKSYREKNKAKLLERDVLRKRLKRVEMKITNPQTNEAR